MKHEAQVRPETIVRNELIIRFYNAPSPRMDLMKLPVERHDARRIATTSARKKDRAPSQQPNIAPSDRGIDTHTEETLAESVHDDVATPASAFPVLDRGKARQVIADIVAEERRNGSPSGSAMKTESSAAARAFAQASRPRCDHDFDAKAGGVHLTGLMKLPSLLLGTVSDKGCKW